MKEALVDSETKVRIIDSPIPVPQPDQVVTKVVVSGSNPKDWKYPAFAKKAANSGDDIAGFVHAVGSNVVEFRPGDRVAAFHEMRRPGGSYAEYAVSWSHTTFHIPKKTTFEGNVFCAMNFVCLADTTTEAATLPLAAMTAAFGLYQRLSLPLPWHPTTERLPLIIYGAATAVGSFAIQMAVQSNIHPLICVAGRGIAHVEKLIDEKKGDVVLDYRKGKETLVQNMKAAVQHAGRPVEYAFDCVSEHNSFQNICEVLDNAKGQITLILPTMDYSDIPDTITKSITMVGSAHGNKEWQDKAGTLVGNEDFAYSFFRYFSRGLDKGYFKPHPYEVVHGGLGGIQTGLQNLRDGKASAIKYIFRLAETEGLERFNVNL